MIRVGFVQRYLGDGWWGALTYYQNLFAAVTSANRRLLTPVLFLPKAAPERILKEFSAYEVITTDLLDPDRLKQAAAEGDAGLQRQERAIEELLVLHGIRLTSHTELLGPRLNVPNIYWIPDFQHERMPEFFSVEQADERRRLFLHQSTLANRIVVSSLDARNDLARHLPDYLNKVFVLRFVSGLGGNVGIQPKDELLARYGLPSEYFFLPNQYWVHKNHILVVRALGLLAREGKRVTVVSTGAHKDFRHADAFQKIMNVVEEEGVGGSYKVLGMVPYADVAALMAHSLAVINPSLFEGWSTSVEEAKAMGKPIILSRIPVHVEQDPARAIFFDPHSVRDLADALTKTHDATAGKSDSELVRLARERNRVAFEQFGELYQAAVMQTLSE